MSDDLIAEFKREFFLQKVDRAYRCITDSGSKHPEVILIDGISVGCISLNLLEGDYELSLSLDYLRIYKQKMGYGTFIMKKLCELANKFNIKILVSVVPQDNGINDITLVKLVPFYLKFGFIPESPGSNIYVREPST